MKYELLRMTPRSVLYAWALDRIVEAKDITQDFREKLEAMLDSTDEEMVNLALTQVHKLYFNKKNEKQQKMVARENKET